MACQKVVSKGLVLNPSNGVHILRSVIAVIHLSYLFVSLVHLRTNRHLSHAVLSCLVSCECEHYARASKFDVGDLTLLTFGNCVLMAAE